MKTPGTAPGFEANVRSGQTVEGRFPGFSRDVIGPKKTFWAVTDRPKLGKETSVILRIFVFLQVN